MATLVKNTLLFIVLLIIGSVRGQTKKIDSIKNELKLHSEMDTVRVNLLNDLAFSYFSSDLVKSLEYLDESDDLLHMIDFKKGKARNLYINGLIQSSESNNQKAIELFKKSLSLYEEGGDERAVSDCYAEIGLAYYNDFDYTKSIENYKKSVNIAKRIGQSKTAAINLKYIGFCYLDMGNYEKAQEYLNYAIDLNMEFDNKLELSSCFNNMGSTHLHKGNYPLALEYYNKSLSIYKTTKDTAGISSVLNNIGILYKNNKEYDKAIANYKESLKIREKNVHKKNKALTLNNIGVVYKQKQDYKNALVYLEDALKLSKSINDKDNIARCLINMGDVYLGINDNSVALQKFLEAKEINLDIGSQLGLCYSYLGLAKVYTNQEKYDEALLNVLKSKELSNSIGVIDYQRDAYSLLSIIYQNLGNYKKALESHQQFKILNDSIFNKKNIEKIAQLEYEYKYKQALDSASIRELKLTKTVLDTSQDLAKSRQNYLWAIIGILVLSIVSGSMIFLQKFNTIKVKNEHIVTEQKLLRSQMTPHFIFNSLSVLQGMILNGEEKKSITYLTKFSKLLRIVLENSRDKVVPLIQELDAIDNYMILQNLDADPPYEYNLLVDENIDINLFLIPPMLIQPFIENAIEHAFMADQEHREIEIHLTFEHNKLSCTITDNGLGIDTTSSKPNTKKKSLATTITKERLEILGKDFKVPGGITIEDRKKDDEQGTKVVLIVPYKIIENS
ncbi:tetratricopeptide repeat protein [Maribacter algicola]|uniref:Tetratricopeptide repeat protein n=1 Tax=Meishania litoralis TaxID=3434685 RepID=A0ACC7LGN7_9FLAO